MGFWTHEHVISIIPTFILMLVFAIVLRKLLINKSYETRMLPIKLIAVILVIIEILKQVISYRRGYNLFHLPLHFCSIFVYVMPLMAFCRGKHQGRIRTIASAAMQALFVGMLIIPNLIYLGSEIPDFFKDFFSFHTVFFHNLVMLAYFLTITLDLHKPEGSKKETLFVTEFGLGFVAIVATMAHVLDTNFSQFLKASADFIDETVKSMELSLGVTPTHIIYVATLAVLHLILLVVANFLFLLICKIKEGIVSALITAHKQ